MDKWAWFGLLMLAVCGYLITENVRHRRWKNAQLRRMGYGFLAEEDGLLPALAPKTKRRAKIGGVFAIGAAALVGTLYLINRFVPPL